MFQVKYNHQILFSSVYITIVVYIEKKDLSSPDRF